VTSSSPLERAVAIVLLFEHVQHPGVHLPVVLVGGQVPPSARRGRLRPNADVLAVAFPHTRLQHLGAHTARLHLLRLEHVPVGDEDAPLGEIRHQVRRHQIARAVQARLSLLGIQLAEPAPDRHVRADDEDDVGVAGVAAVVNFVEDAPGGQHPP
jgi:hypothetical protein